jgi:hypothetical protein
MSRIRIDLKKLPVWQQYVIALVVVTIVVAAAWAIGRNTAVPVWITNYFVPLSGWIGILVLLYLFLVRKKR